MDIKLKIPEGYLNEEMRDGYLVSSEMKKIWVVELDLLNEFIRVCDKYNIIYFANGGTMLGAARHKGFIPWDNDIDIMMFRTEYEKLCKIAPSEFKAPYFFQTEDSDPGSLRGHAQLRNSNTTGILNSELNKKLKFNQGIFIDIFPMDNIPDDEKERNDFLNYANKLKSIFRRKRRLFMLRGHFYFRKNVFRLFYDYICIYFISKRKLEENARKSLLDYETFISQYKDIPTKASRVPLTLNTEYYRKDFLDVEYLPFEMLKIAVPSGYLNVLRDCYGSWEKPIKTVTIHGGVFFDTEKSYLDYL